MKTIEGKNINLRAVDIDDAAFILRLRIQNNKSKFLSSVENNIEKQQAWLTSYKSREELGKEFYFVIESKEHCPLGLVRIYDLKTQSFCWGSWIIIDDAPRATAIESALMIYEFAFNNLNYPQAHFDVMKGNKKVVNFHLRFGAKIIDEDDLNYYFTYKREDYSLIRKKYARYIK